MVLYETIEEHFDTVVKEKLKWFKKENKIMFTFRHVFEYLYLRDDILLKSLEKDLFYLFDNVYYQKNDDYRMLYLLLKIDREVSEKVYERMKKNKIVEFIKFEVLFYCISKTNDRELKEKMSHEFIR